MTRYKLLAVDVDGTLLGPEHRLSDAHATAVRRAKRAGLAVCLCTGRSVTETRGVWQACGFEGKADPMICITGALVCEGDTARTLHIEPMSRAAALLGGQVIGRSGRSAVAVVDGWRWGFDYYFIEGGDAALVRRCWLDRHACRVRVVRGLEEPAELPEILRLTAVDGGDGAAGLEADLGARADGHFQFRRIHAPNLGVDLVECFAPSVSKWAGIRYVAQGLRIARRDIVAVGDDVNDLSMLAKAGLGVAMGNAREPVKQAADLVIGRHDEDGLAAFVERLLEGAYDQGTRDPEKE